MKNLWLAAALLCLVMSGCQTGPSAGEPTDNPFWVTVLKTSGDPLEGAVIEGGIDWESFEITTDSSGRAKLPGYARNYETIIHLDNYLPRSISLRWPYRYTLTPTPKILRLLGNVEGSLVRFTPGRLATVDYHGTYHLYAVDDNGLAEIASASVPRTVKQTRLIGDTLWLSTYDDGIFAYSLADPEHPVEQLHLDIPGTTPVFALHDNMIVVGNSGNVLALGVYLFEADGSFVEMSRLGDYYVSSIAFVEGYLVVSGYRDANPRVYSLDEPSHPVLVSGGAYAGYWSGFLYGHQYVQIPEWDQITENTIYGRLDLSNPDVPLAAGTVRADSRLIGIVDDATAIGYYHTLGNALSVLKGSLTGGFQTVALISEDPHYDLNEFGGCVPPYYVISNRLWVLEDRIIPGPSR
jgi:hypothetical protein